MNFIFLFLSVCFGFVNSVYAMEDQLSLREFFIVHEESNRCDKKLVEFFYDLPEELRSAIVLCVADNKKLWYEKQRFQHNSWIISACLNKDETQLVTASEDRTARIWCTKTGQQLQSFQHNDLVVSACLNKDETQLVTASHDRTACIWCTKTGQQLQSFQHNGWVISACLNKDETQLVTASEDRTACIWQRYNDFTLDQLLLCKLLFAWLMVEKPDKRIDSIDLLIKKICMVTGLSKDELNVLLDTFSPKIQQFMWSEIHRLICKYGK